ncbi:heterokaryon incompatibility protein-domain-containing protein [Whalleya microplaca]|nr:heterokaryon incompatibility protein-domain-containing protein [Whalleya microplaca]
MVQTPSLLHQFMTQSSAMSPPPLCAACTAIFADDSFDWWKCHQACLLREQPSECWPRGITPESLTDDGNDERSTVPRGPDGRVIEFPRQHHPSEQSFCDAVATGCWICYRVFMTYTGQEEAEAFNSRYNCYRLALRETIFLFYHSANNPYELKFPNGCSISCLEIESWTSLPLCELAYNSMSVPNTGSRETGLLASEWLKTCRESHKTCQHKTETTWYPTRLLHISENTIRLIYPRDEPEFKSHYATLSYCWGREEFLVLNSKTIADFEKAIPIHCLPRIFQETIKTVRALEIGYLWIDSCCILQGQDKDAIADWEREAGQMQEVYSHSYLNICSADSKSPSEGLFRSRRPQDSKIALLKWKCVRSQQPRYHYLVDARRWDATRDVLDGLSGLYKSHIISRAWVLQEIVLSSRLLLFTSKQIYWQCNELAASEDFPRAISLYTIEIWGNPFWVLTNEDDETPEYQNVRITRKWFGLLDRYSEAKLTYPEKDIFRAIEGLGRRFGQLIGRDYQRGLLSGSLQLSLLWRPRYGTSGNRPLLAPDWHWATHSIHGSVDFKTYRKWLSEPDDNRAIPLAYIFMSDDCRQLPPMIDGPGDLWPHLMCIGRLIPVELDKTPRLNGSMQVFISRSKTGELHPPGFYTWLDFPEAGIVQEGNKLTYFPLVNSIKKPHWWNPRMWPFAFAVHGLLLREIEKGQYRRVGITEHIFWSGYNAKYRRRNFDYWKHIISRPPSLFTLE